MNALKPMAAKEARPMPKQDLNFLEFLQTFRRGELLTAGDDRLTELITAIEETGGKGALTLKISFSKNKAGQIEIVPDLSIKKPTRAIGTGIYFATEDMRLTRRDPNQMDIEDEIERRRNLDA